MAGSTAVKGIKSGLELDQTDLKVVFAVNDVP